MQEGDPVLNGHVGPVWGMHRYVCERERASALYCEDKGYDGA